jgi:uncharacterized protein YjbI with pentapeptide repeats
VWGAHGEFWQFLGKYRPGMFGEWAGFRFEGDFPTNCDPSIVILYGRPFTNAVVGQAEAPGRFMRLSSVNPPCGYMVADANRLPNPAPAPYESGMAMVFAWDARDGTLTGTVLPEGGGQIQIWSLGGFMGYGIYVQRPGEGAYVRPFPAQHVMVTPGFDALKANPSAQLNLRCVDFVGEDCRGLIAPYCDFSYANFTAVSFAGGDLTGSNFTNACLRNAQLAGAKFGGCTFAQAQLGGADIRGLDLGGLNLSGADLTGVQCDGSTRLAGRPGAVTNLSSATLPFALLGKDWSYIDLTGAKITGLPRDLSGLRAVGTTFSRKVSLAHCDLSQAQLQGATLRGVTMTQANLEDADLTGAKLGELDDVLGATLNFAYIANANLAGADLYAAALSGATLFGAKTNVVGAILEDADLSNAYLAGIDLRGAKMRGATFDGACLINVQLDGSDVQKIEGRRAASFVGAWLQGASFAGAKLGDVNFSGAFVAFEKGTQMVQHYGETGALYPADDDFRPLAHGPTLGLGAGTLLDSTTCPNGDKVSDNRDRGLSYDQMLESLHPLPSHWSPGSAAGV